MAGELTRVATFKPGRRREAIVLEINGRQMKIDHADLSTFKNAKAMEAAIRAQAATSNVKLPPIFVHVNRDGSLALATGAAPNRWPEDDLELGPGQEEGVKRG